MCPVAGDRDGVELQQIVGLGAQIGKASRAQERERAQDNSKAPHANQSGDCDQIQVFRLDSFAHAGKLARASETSGKDSGGRSDDPR